MSDRDEAEGPDPLELDGSQEFDDASSIEDDEEPRARRARHRELEVEAAAADLASDVELTDREAAANAAAEAARGPQRRDALRWALRAGAGLAAAGVATAAVLGAGALPEDAVVRAEPPTTLVQPAAPLQSRVCAGPAVRIGTADGQDALARAAIAQPQVAVGSLGGEVGQQALVAPDGSDASTAVDQRGESSTLSAAQSLDVAVDAARGFAASECAETSLDQWLVGGSTRTGRQSVLTIANASDVSASVDITVHGADGPVPSVGSSGVAVAPGSVETIDLAAIAPGVEDAVVHVASTGAPVAAHLQQTTTRGLARGGFDVVDPVQALTTAVLVGITIEAPTGVETEPDHDDTVPLLRLLSPSGGAVTVELQSEDGTVTTSEGTLEPGRVTDFPLEEIPLGDLVLRIESDAPVVAGARAVANDAAGLDLDWVAGGQPRSGASAIAVPAGPSPTLHVVSASDEAQEVVVGGERIALPAGGAIAREVAPGTVDVEGTDVVLAVAYRGDGLVGGFTASPQGPTAEGIRVVH
ncbi:DUF5719 family protein [Agrococcus terreus]|uniref:DUF5719 family protein n=1 Tax=Agrococcus terreus TaxID=574649 RepID=UPI003850C7E9